MPPVAVAVIAAMVPVVDFVIVVRVVLGVRVLIEAMLGVNDDTSVVTAVMTKCPATIV